MMRSLIICFLLVEKAFAGDVPAIEPSAQTPLIDSVVFEKKALNSKEKKAAELAKEWIEARSMPIRKEGGKVVYQYGATLPTAICAPLSLCDIELQPGESIVGNPMVGDSARWLIKPALSGTGSSQISHIIIKPTDAGISTTAIITTNRRTYHIKLVSSKTNWTPLVAFTYPEDIEREWVLYNAKTAERLERNTLPDTKQNMDNLNFDYEIKGKASWTPLRIYNDGLKTYIQMPKTMSQTEAPALLLIDSDGQKQIVNYRLIHDRYIVDQIFSKAILIAGVGSSEESIIITHKKSQVGKEVVNAL